MTAFKPGDRVRCVDAGGLVRAVREGDTYTITAIDGMFVGVAGLRGGDAAFAASRFVPADPAPFSIPAACQEEPKEEGYFAAAYASLKLATCPNHSSIFTSHPSGVCSKCRAEPAACTPDDQPIRDWERRAARKAAMAPVQATKVEPVKVDERGNGVARAVNRLSGNYEPRLGCSEWRP